jgi:hypothetical protein
MQDALSGSWITSQFLLNHNQTKAIVGIHKNLANNATRDGVPYFLGETNSLSVCIISVLFSSYMYMYYYD